MIRDRWFFSIGILNVAAGLYTKIPSPIWVDICCLILGTIVIALSIVPQAAVKWGGDGKNS